MNLAASFEFHAGGTAYRFRPLTVRERIGLSNAIVERERRKAVTLAKELELSGAERVEARPLFCRKRLPPFLGRCV